MNIKKQTKFYGYRGTSKKWGEKWEKYRQLKFSAGEDEYLGHGYYFFENDYNEAVNWAKYVRKIKPNNIAIIFADIETNNILDLIDGKTYQQYIKVINSYKKKFKYDSDPPIINTPYDCNIINLLTKRYNYDMVRGPFHPKYKEGLRLTENGETRMMKTHIQLCILNKDIIKDSEVEYL